MPSDEPVFPALPATVETVLLSEGANPWTLPPNNCVTKKDDAEPAVPLAVVTVMGPVVAPDGTVTSSFVVDALDTAA